MDRPRRSWASCRTRWRTWTVSPSAYRRVCQVALGLVGFIVVTGAAVRLTGSGLGCDDWPACNDSKLVDVSTGHAAIEQINRLLTGVVAAMVILAVLVSRRRSPRRRDLTMLSYGLVAGVLGQIVLGGITVLVDLHPIAVQSHLLVSMALVANAVVLVRRAGQPDGERRVVTTDRTRRHTFVVAAATGVAIAFGTVVTGAGPHAGDRDARRFDIAISAAAQVHSIAVWVAVAVALALALRLSKRASDRNRLDDALVAWISIALLQAAVGYIQYFNGIPALLVALHVGLATLLWAITTWMVTLTTDVEAAPSAQTLDELDALVDHV